MPSIEKLKEFVKVKVHQQGQAVNFQPGEGQLHGQAHIRTHGNIPGHELQAAGKHLEVISAKDPVMGKRIQSMFQTLPKYSVLEIITNEAGEYFKAHPEAIKGILESVAGPDYEYANKIVQGG